MCDIGSLFLVVTIIITTVAIMGMANITIKDILYGGGKMIARITDTRGIIQLKISFIAQTKIIIGTNEVIRIMARGTKNHSGRIIR